MSQQKSSSHSTRRFADKEFALVKRSDREQSDFRSFVSKCGNFSEEQKSALTIDSAQAFENFWSSTLDVKAEFETNHDHGVGLAVRRINNFAASAYDIINHLEPIVQLVKHLGAPYGGMAIGTICFLFAIAKNRASIESKILATLLQIRDRIAGLRVYRHIYNDDHELDQQLQSKIVLVYDSFISFCIAATKYYSKGSMKRWLKALWGSSETLDDRASKVQEVIVEVRLMSEELLNKNVDAIKQLNIGQAKEIEALKAQIKKLQEGRDGDRLNKIQILLGLETYSREIELELFNKYYRDINADFDQNWGPYLERMSGPRLETFKKDPAFQDWRQSPASRMLILEGYNHESAYAARECWLSFVAIDTIASLSRSNTADPYAFYLLGRREPDLYPQVLSSIIIQLLHANRHALQNESDYSELCAVIQEYRKAITFTNDDHEGYQSSGRANELLRNVALRILNMTDSTKTVWIILDRVDRCRARPGVNHQKTLVKALVHLVEKTKVKVRVLAVVSGYEWRVEEQKDEFDQTSPSSVYIHTDRQRIVD